MFRIMSFAFLALELMSHAAHAQAILVLEGTDRSSGQACQLVHESTDPDGRYVVSTSYSHDGDAPDLLRILPSGGVWEGQSSDGHSTIRVSVSPGSVDLSGARAFVLRWLHHDHYHQVVCRDLRRL
jgi:hypothetical protein